MNKFSSLFLAQSNSIEETDQIFFEIMDFFINNYEIVEYLFFFSDESYSLFIPLLCGTLLYTHH